MAQAARQNLRMQKELKLLLTDPPPGVSLSASSSSSLTNIDAEIKGPEGTVYANGVFHIKIQIPERYPFQPPNVTFATPIYHPNIDTGGRICLDILNLPPKGAWQPSLNISTVLMSIGLLLSEPNPDDGLMCEASREYKYNRQTFDQKARSMTEKYAKSGVSGGSIASGRTPAKPSPLMAEVEERSMEPKTSNDEHVDHKRLGRVSRKLSLEFSATSQKRNENDDNNVADADSSSFLRPQTLVLNASASFPRQDLGIHNEQQPNQDDNSKAGSESIDLCPGMLSGRPHKLSLRSSLSHQIMPDHDKENAMQTHSFHTNTKINSVTSSSPFQPKINEHVAQQLDRDHEIGSESQKKVTGIGRKLSLHSSCSIQRKSDKDIVTDTNSRVLVSKSEHISVSTKSPILQMNENDDRKQPHKVYNEQRNKGRLNVTRRKLGIGKKLPVETATTFKWEDDGNKENVPPNYQLILENHFMTSPSLVMPQASNSNAESPQEGHDHGVQYGKSVGHKKSFGSGKKALMLSSGTARTRLMENQKVEQLSPHYQNPDDIPLSSKSLQLMHVGVHDDEAHRGSGGQGLVNSTTKKNEEEITDAVIVLDSEDSEEEVKVSTRSRLSIARKPLAGKRKAKA